MTTDSETNAASRRSKKPASRRPRRRKQERQVALAFPIAPAHLHAVTRGIVDYAGQHGGWLMTTHGESADLPIESLRGWNGDGIIGILQLSTPEEQNHPGGAGVCY